MITKNDSKRMSILVIGPDGSGKSTLVRTLASSFGKRATPLYLGVGREQWKSKIAERIYYFPAAGSQFATLLLPVRVVALLIDLRLRVPLQTQVAVIDRFPLGLMAKSRVLHFLISSLVPPIFAVINLVGDPEVFRQRSGFEDSRAEICREARLASEAGKTFRAQRIVDIDSSSADAPRVASQAMLALQ